jgi:hypothetical protein
MKGLASMMLVALAACASSKSTDRVTEGQRTVGTTEEMTRMVGGTEYLDIRTEKELRLSSFNVAASADSVWAVLPAVLQDLGVPIGVLLSDSREVGVTNHRVRRHLGKLPLARLLDCGGPMGVPNANSYNVSLTVLSHVVAQTPATSTIKTQVEATAMPTGVSSTPVRCITKGYLESQIAMKVREQMMH